MSATTATSRAREVLGCAELTDATLGAWLRSLPGVDVAGCEERERRLRARTLTGAGRAAAIDTAISMVDLTTLEGADTPATVGALCATAKAPDPQDPDAQDPSTPRPAAVCVYNDLVAVAKDALAGTDIHVAAVATAFPSGRASRRVRLLDVTDAIEAGADEIDMVIDRGAFLSGRYRQVLDDVAAVKQACRGAHLKVILETGELAGYDDVRRAAWLAMLGGADVVKTSTGKISPAATLPVTTILLQAVRDWHLLTGEVVGVKPAGGIRTTPDALAYLVAVDEIAGPDWLTPDRFRFGASGLLGDLVAQRRRVRAALADSATTS